MIKLIAHRGNGVSFYVENSKEALLQCLDTVGIDGVELDVRLSKDQEVVIHHDISLERTSNGIGLVREKTLKELKQYVFGKKGYQTKLATLDEFLKEVRSTKKIIIELKEENGDEILLVQALVKVILKYRYLNLYFVSFRKDIIDLLIKKVKGIRASVFVGELIHHNALSYYSFHVVTPERLDEIQMAKEVIVWKVKNKKTMEKVKRLVGEKTVSVITDTPLLYLQ